MFKLLIITALTMSAAAPALARPQTDKKQQDPNRVICRTEDVIGSRLMTKRHCMTAQQWSDLRQETRRSIERIQRLEARGG